MNIRTNKRILRNNLVIFFLNLVLPHLTKMMIVKLVLFGVNQMKISRRRLLKNKKPKIIKNQQEIQINIQ